MAWASARFGVVTRRKLLAFGLTPAQIEQRLAVRWLLPTRFDGVYLVGHHAHVPGQREAVALAASGPGTVLAARSSSGWDGLTEPWRGRIELLVPKARAGTLHGVSRSAAELHPGDVRVVRGLPCTSVRRTILDLAPVAPELLPRALVEALRRGVDVEPLHPSCRGRRGAVALRGAVEDLIPELAHTLSELEVASVACSVGGGSRPARSTAATASSSSTARGPGAASSSSSTAGAGTSTAGSRTSPATGSATSRVSFRSASAGATSSGRATRPPIRSRRRSAAGERNPAHARGRREDEADHEHGADPDARARDDR